MTDPSSLEAQQILLITFPSPLPLQSFCILSFILTTLSSPLGCLTGGGGDPFLPLFLKLGGSLGLSNGGWEFQGYAGRKQLSEGHPLPQGGSCTLQHWVGKGNHLEIKIKSFLQQMKEEADTFFSVPGIPPLSSSFLFYSWILRGKPP